MTHREGALRTMIGTSSQKRPKCGQSGHRRRLVTAAVCAVVESLEPRMLLSAASLVYDVNHSTASSSPSAFFTVGNELYFDANDGVHGVQVWKTDGTAVGTTMVTNLSSPVHAQAALGNEILLAGTSGLWVTNGTPSGTVQLSTVQVGQGVVSGSHYFFAGTDATHGTELWESDGTTAGTILLDDINSGTASSTPVNFAQINGEIYFSASSPNVGAELWKSDGTAAGTVMVKDINTGLADSSPYSLVNMGGKLYFLAHLTNQTALFTSDGTAAGTQQVSSVVADTFPNQGAPFTTTMSVIGSTLYFQGTDSTHGTELWKSDGTSAGTSMVADLFAGTGSTYDLSQVYSLNGKLYFWGDSQLWQTDGTSAGTVSIAQQQYLLPPMNVVAAGNYLYYDSPFNGQLWRTDGTTAGTTLVSSNIPRIYTSGIHGPWIGVDQMSIVNGAVLLNGWTATPDNIELLAIAPDASQPTLLKDINATTTTDGSNPNDFVRVGNQTFFVAWDGTTADYQLWVTDGTAANSRSLLDLGINYLRTLPLIFTSAPLGSSLVFSYQNQLWISDGTVAGTQMVTNFSGLNIISLHDMVNMGNHVYFAAADGGKSVGNELWASDGTAAGTYMVDDINPGTGSSGPANLTAAGNTLYFSANDGVDGTQLWKTDGTAHGTMMLSNTSAGITQIIAVGATVYAQSGIGLMKSDGTVAGTVFIPGPQSLQSTTYANLAAVGNEVYFTADTAASGWELWKTDGAAAGTQMVIDLAQGPASSSPQDLTSVGSELYFVALDSTGQYELFKTDGTAAGTVQLTHDLTYSPSPSNQPFSLQGIRFLTAAGNVLFFGANDSVDGDELWRTDGTVAGTFMVQDIGPGDSLNDMEHSIPPDNGTPQIVPMDGFVLFVGNNHQIGQELWRTTTGPILGADAGGPYKVLEGQSVTLSAAGSIPAGSSIVSYQWDLNYSGDGGNFTVDATGPTATLSNLDGPATRIVAVRVTDANGNTSLDTAAVHIFNVPPTLSISGPPTINQASPTYTLNLSSSDPGPDTISSWTITWGDGTTQVVSGNPSSVTHVYPSATANYTISATATDEDGTYNLQSIPVGTQDPTFGANGIAANSGFASGGKVAIQPDGKIVSVGSANNGFIISRHNADGSLDTSFGTGGNVVSDPSTSPPQAKAVAIQSDGRIIVAGSYAVTNGFEWVIERFLPNGTLDSSFGSGGILQMQPPASVYNQISAIAIQASGGILIAGTSLSSGSGVVAGLMPDGSLNSSFGSGGSAAIGYMSVSAMILQPDGKILLAGSSSPWDLPMTFYVARLTTSGTADTTFGTNGSTDVAFSSDPSFVAAEADCIALQANGSIVVGGRAADSNYYNNEWGEIVARYTPSGSLDQTFGTASSGFWYLSSYTSTANIVALAVQADGQILMLGSGTWLLKQLTSSGTLNSTFGNSLSGVAGYDGVIQDGTFVAGDMALEPNGQIIVGGNTSTGSDLMRFGGLTSGPTVQVAPATASISGTFFYDFNGNGIWDSGEAISPSWGVFLDTNGDGIYESGEPELICNSQGQYTFSNLLPGTYRVHPTSATNWTETAPPGGTQIVNAISGQTIANVNFGEVKGAAKTSSSSTALFTGDSYSVNISYGGFHSVTSWTLNWGDGSVQTITGSPTSASHTYASGSGTSPFTILAWANTVDGDAPAAPLTLAVYAAPLLNNGLLSLAGTSGNDAVSFTSSGGLLTLNLDGAAKQYNSSAVTKVSYASNGGNDTINLSGAIPATLNLASGNSTVTNGDSSPVYVATGTGKTTINATAGTTIIPANTGTGIQQLDFAAINISAGAKVVFATSSSTLGDYSHHANRNVAVVDAGGLNISSGGILDMGDNDMILKYDSANESATRTQVFNLLQSGITPAGDWSGTGITSSEANYDSNFGIGARALGWMDNNDIQDSSFDGVSLSDFNEVMIKFTYYGDVDLSGTFDATDVNQLIAGRSHTPGDTGWEFCDLDYDGVTSTAQDQTLFFTGRNAYQKFGAL